MRLGTTLFPMAACLAVMVPPVQAFIHICAMPAEGTWAEWRITSSEMFAPGVDPKVRLTAGEIIDRGGRKMQVLELSGVWQDNEKPSPLKARYEVDLDRLAKDGHARAAAKPVEAWLEVDGKLEKLAPDDRRMQPYEIMFYRVTQMSKEEDADKPREPQLARYKTLTHVLGKVDTRHYGSGQAAESDFEGWIGDDVPFGVAQCQVETKLPVGRGESTTITMSAALTDTGTVESVPTMQPGVVVLDELEDSYLPVPFDHKGHARMAEMTRRCVVCHHCTPEGRGYTACKTCHSVEVEGTSLRRSDLKTAYHRRCLNCHETWADASDCDICHLSRGGSPGAAGLRAPTVDEVLGRMHPPISPPKTKIYRAEFTKGAESVVIFRHWAHISGFGVSCEDCHYEPSCIRCHSTGADRKPRTVGEHHKPCIYCHGPDMREPISTTDAGCKRCHWEKGDPVMRPFEQTEKKEETENK